MLPEPFKSLLDAPSPAFLCKIAAARSSPKRYIAPVKFGLQKGLGAKAGDMLSNVGLAASSELEDFYSQHDGMTLFSCAVTGKCPLEIYRAKAIPAKTRAMRRWFKINDLPEIEPIVDPYCLRTAIAVGGSPHSASYLAIAIEGNFAGRVFVVDHGGLPDGPLAESFAALLAQAGNDPIGFLNAAANYARYADGKTAIIWQPIEFSLTGTFSQ